MSTNKKIIFYRHQIDEIDRQLCQLLTKRLKLADLIGQQKIKKRHKIKDEAREKEIIDNVSKKTVPDLQKSVIKIFKAIISESRNRQKR